MDSFLGACADRTADCTADSSLVRVLERHAHTQPDARLYTWLRDDLSESAILTYAELRSAALALCHALMEFWPFERRRPRSAWGAADQARCGRRRCVARRSTRTHVESTPVGS